MTACAISPRPGAAGAANAWRPEPHHCAPATSITSDTLSSASSEDTATPAVIAAGVMNTASNSATLVGGQFLDGGMGQVGLQWQDVTIKCPIRIVNNVLSVTVSGTNTHGVTVQDVTFA